MGGVAAHPGRVALDERRVQALGRPAQPTGEAVLLLRGQREQFGEHGVVQLPPDGAQHPRVQDQQGAVGQRQRLRCLGVGQQRAALDRSAGQQPHHPAAGGAAAVRLDHAQAVADHVVAVAAPGVDHRAVPVVGPGVEGAVPLQAEDEPPAADRRAALAAQLGDRSAVGEVQQQGRTEVAPGGVLEGVGGDQHPAGGDVRRVRPPGAGLPPADQTARVDAAELAVPAVHLPAVPPGQRPLRAALRTSAGRAMVVHDRDPPTPHDPDASG